MFAQIWAQETPEAAQGAANEISRLSRTGYTADPAQADEGLVVSAMAAEKTKKLCAKILARAQSIRDQQARQTEE